MLRRLFASALAALAFAFVCAFAFIPAAHAQDVLPVPPLSARVVDQTAR